MIIGLFGFIGCGKDTAAEYLVDQYGFAHISFGDIVRDVAREQDMNTSIYSLLEVQRECIEKHGPTFFSKRVVKEVKKVKGDVVVSGIRRIEDVQELKKTFGNKFILVMIEADQDIRFERTKSRKKLGDPKTYEEFIDQEGREASMFGFYDVLEMVDEKIFNNGPKEGLYAEIDRLIERMTVDDVEL